MANLEASYRESHPAPEHRPEVDAFERLFATYLGRLTRYVMSYVRSWDAAQDIVHDVFLQYWQRQQSAEPIRDVEAYLYTLARNRALDYRRRRVTERLHREEAAASTAAGADYQTNSITDGERHILASEVAAMVQRAVDALPARQREVLLLRCQHEAGYQEIAARLGIASKTVDTHFQRAIRTLRRILERSLR